MNKEFQSHVLNQAGIDRSNRIAQAFDNLLSILTTPATPDDPTILCPPGRETALVRTKLEEASFFAKKAMASAPENQIVVSASCAAPMSLGTIGGVTVVGGAQAKP